MRRFRLLRIVFYKRKNRTQILTSQQHLQCTNKQNKEYLHLAHCVKCDDTNRFKLLLLLETVAWNPCLRVYLLKSMWFERYLSLEGLFAQIVTDSMAPGSDSVPAPFARVVYILGAVIHPFISDGFIAQRLVSELLKRKVPEWNPNPDHKICQEIHFSAHFQSEVSKLCAWCHQ